MDRLRRLGRIVVLGAVVLANAGCGAMVARAKIVSAETVLGAAKRADAERKAPYEYTSALLYLEKAREEEAYARFGPAIQFSGLSETFAGQAKLKAATAEPEPTP